MINFLNTHRINYKKDIELKKFSFFKSGGKLKYLIYPENIHDLTILTNFLSEKDINYKIIGATSNMLFLDNKDYGVCISLRKFNDFNYNKGNGVITVEAGLMLPGFVKKTANLEVKGFEGLEGIPGTIGAAVFMNAGAYGYEIKDNLIDIDLLKNGEIIKMNKDDLKFSYRHSILKENNYGILIKARFKANVFDEKSIINERIKKFRETRKKFLEYKHPNLGSIFATSDLYYDIAKHYKFYKFVILFTRKFIYKVLKPNNNKLLNSFTSFYFNWKFKNKPYSDKTLNCLINNNSHTNESLKYINEIKRITNNSVKLENEVLYDNFGNESALLKDNIQL